METAELQTASPENESRARDNAVAPPLRENGLSLRPLDHILSGTAGEPQGGGVGRLLRKASLSHSANRPVRALALQRAQQSHGNLFTQRALAGRSVQRHCSCGGTCEKCRALDEVPTASLKPIEEPVPLLQRQSESLSDVTSSDSHEHDLIPSDSGQPIDAETRGFMEARFNTDFSDVRVHTDTGAAQSAETFQANAYTSGRDIYFAAGRYAPSTPQGRYLLAHELTHTIQQGNAPAPNVAATQAHEGVLIGRPDDPLEREADQTADLVLTSASGLATHPTPTAATAHSVSKSKSIATSKTSRPPDVRATIIARQAAPGTAEAAPEEEGWLEGKMWGLLEEYAPNLVPIIRRGPEGVFDWIKDKVTGAIRSFVDTMMAPVRGVASTGKWLQGHFAQLLVWMQDAAAKIAQNDCHPITEAAQKIEDLAAEFITPVIAKLRQIADKVGDFLKGVWEKFGAPVWEFIKNYAGQQWEQLQKLGEWIWDKTAPVRNRVASAWTWLKNKIGIGEGPEGQNGVLQWIQAKAGAAWEWVQGKLEPYKKQIATVATIAGGIAVLISPAGPVLLAGAAIVGVVQGVRWIRANLGNGDAIVRARTYAQTVLIPQLLGAIGKMTGAVTHMATSVSAKLGEFSAGLAGVVGAAASTALHFLVEAAQWLADRAMELSAWATDKLAALADWIQKGLERLRTFLRPVMDFLTKVGNLLADIYGLPMLLGEALWNKIPKCIRDPFVDWIIPLILRQIDIFKELVKDNEAWQKTKADVMNIVRMVFVTKDLLGAVRATFHLILRVFNVPVELLMTVVQKAAVAWDIVVAAPIKFLKNCVRTVGRGLQLYWEHLKDNLLFGLEGWLFGELAEKGITKPQSWTDPWDIAQFVLSVMGLSINHLFDLMQKRFDKTTVDKLRVWYGRLGRVWDWITEIRGKKPGEVTAEIIASAKGFAKSILEGIVIWIVEKVSTELATMAAAAAASAGLSEVLDAIRRVYRAIKTAVRWMRSILEMVNNALESVMNIAAGTIGPAAAVLEGAMKRATPAVIGFLGDQVGLGGIADKIREIIDDLRAKVDEAILAIIDKLKEFFTTIIHGSEDEAAPESGKQKKLRGSEVPDERTPEQKQNDLDSAIIGAYQLMQADSDVETVRRSLPKIRTKYRLSSLDLVIDTESSTLDTVHIEGEVNPKKSGGPAKLSTGKKRGDHVFANGLSQTISELLAASSEHLGTSIEGRHLEEALSTSKNILAASVYHLTVDKGAAASTSDAHSLAFGTTSSAFKLSLIQYMHAVQSSRTASPTPEDLRNADAFIRDAAMQVDLALSEWVRSAIDSEAAAMMPEKKAEIAAGKAGLEHIRVLIMAAVRMQRVTTPQTAIKTSKADTPVQRKVASSVAVDSKVALDIARGGVARAGSALPHADAIQNSFGHHDIAETKTQIGGDGAKASEAIGAKAFAHGDRVAFASSPDLHTAAHEAAHIVQQRSGRGPADGLDGPGDQLEQHANQVADAVVAGKLAQPLLDHLGSPGGQATAVQRQPASTSSTLTSQNKAAPAVPKPPSDINLLFNALDASHRLIESIDQSQIKIEDDPDDDSRFFKRKRLVRHVDFPAVLAVLSNRTADEVKAVEAEYLAYEHRPLQYDLFGRGESHVWSDLTADQIHRLKALLGGTQASSEEDAEAAAQHRREGDVAELHALLNGSLRVREIERVMTLLRRPAEEAAALLNEYNLNYNLQSDLFRMGFSNAIRAMMLLSGSSIAADAYAIGMARNRIMAIDKELKMLQPTEVTATDVLITLSQVATPSAAIQRRQQIEALTAERKAQVQLIEERVQEAAGEAREEAEWEGKDALDTDTAIRTRVSWVLGAEGATEHVVGGTSAKLIRAVASNEPAEQAAAQLRKLYEAGDLTTEIMADAFRALRVQAAEEAQRRYPDATADELKEEERKLSDQWFMRLRSTWDAAVIGDGPTFSELVMALAGDRKDM
jgi:hypothetical protein